MFLARVIGTVVATVKAAGLEGAKLLVIQPLDSKRAPLGGPEVACDQAQAGPGDLVFCVGKREASLAMPDPFCAVDSAIVGIVDRVDRAGAPR